MADVKDEEFDLTFLDEDGIDVDVPDAASTRLIHLDKDTEIPKRYLIRKIFSPHLEPPAHYHPAAEESQRRKKVLVVVCHRLYFYDQARDIVQKPKGCLLIIKACPERFDFTDVNATG